MSTIGEAAGSAQTTAKRQLYCSPLDRYWDAFRAWWKRERLRSQLCHLTDHELGDIGLTRGEIDHVVSRRVDPGGDRFC